MNTGTRVFLVLLRVAVGWHLLVEGLDKLESLHTGPTVYNKPFSSAGYLRESSGPLRGWFRWQGGDPDAAALERLAVQPVPAGVDPASDSPDKRMPPALNQDWDDYLARFKAHYGLDDDQAKLAQGLLDQSKYEAVRWLEGGTKEVERTLGGSTYKAPRTTPERIAEYKETLAKVREVESHELPIFRQDVRKKELRDLKADAAKQRTDLLADLDHFLTDPGLPPAMLAAVGASGTPVKARPVEVVLTAEQKKKDPLPPPPPPAVLVWTDRLVSWGLTIVGACLILGLFTRTSAVFGALFMLAFYLAMPPWPGVPENLKAEGHYFLVNKNLIEMLALFALATTASGRWLGLDGLLHALNPFRRTAPPAPARAAPQKSHAVGV
jgi:uncharacterized membrane protein YphA (DoxX/SURF4 family)